uniref:Uncharacterized protein n=1 Tax=Octopus bimaculoides TaxID=37653 RepID=A0A0L8HKF8_OCTBM
MWSKSEAKAAAATITAVTTTTSTEAATAATQARPPSAWADSKFKHSLGNSKLIPSNNSRNRLYVNINNDSNDSNDNPDLASNNIDNIVNNNENSEQLMFPQIFHLQLLDVSCITSNDAFQYISVNINLCNNTNDNNLRNNNITLDNASRNLNSSTCDDTMNTNNRI